MNLGVSKTLPVSLLYVLASTSEEDDISFVSSTFPLDISNQTMDNIGMIEGGPLYVQGVSEKSVNKEIINDQQ